MLPAHTRLPRATVTQAAQPSAGSAAGRESASASVPAADFLQIHVRGDGDCLFRAVYLGLTHAQRPDSETSSDKLTDMRQRVTHYIDSHWATLQNNDCFLDENTSPQGLRSLVAAERQWDSDNGDLVPLFLAHTLGRDVKIFRHEQDNPHRYQLIQNCPGNNATLPGGSASSDAEPICLLYIGLNHYSYLQPDQAQNQASGLPAAGPRPSKKPRLGVKKTARVKSELSVSGKQRGRTQPPLVPFTVTIQSGLAYTGQDQRQGQAPGQASLSQRFHISPTLSLDRAISTAHSTVMPMTWISDADIATMSQRPIIQHPQDPNQAHPSLQQPAQANMKSRLNEILNHSPKLQAAHVSTDLLKQVRAQLNDLLKRPEKRQAYEASHFTLAQIEAKNLPDAISANHPTLKMRGVLAQQKLPAGTPLQYSGQYLDKKQWQAGVNELSQILQSKSGFALEEAQAEAERAMGAYAWGDATYRNKKYDISAFGAGNVAAMINHDAEHANMGAAYFSTQDKDGQPAAKVMVYFALREIAAGEQLLVDYGDAYSFDKAAEGEAAVSSAKPGHISGNLAGRVKSEPVFATHIETDWAPTAPALEEWPQDLAEASLSSAISSDNNSDHGDGRASVSSARIATLSTNLLPEAWREPPAGYNNKSDHQQVLIRCEYREKIRQCYQEKKPAATILPERLLNDQFPLWCQPKLTLEKWQELPANYSALNELQRSYKRNAARRLINEFNKNKGAEQALPLFKWCQVTRKRGFAHLQTLLQPPADFDQLTRKQQSKKKVQARAVILKYNRTLKEQGKPLITFPDWVKITPRTTETMSREAFIERWREPPEGYEHLSDNAKRNRREKARSHIQVYNDSHTDKAPVAIPLWCRSLRSTLASSTPDEKNRQECPEALRQPPDNYRQLSDERVSELQAEMRKTVDELNKKQAQQHLPLYCYADWFKPYAHNAIVSLTSRMQPPPGYSEMSDAEKRTKRDTTRALFSRVNQRLQRQGRPVFNLPLWCQIAEEKTANKSLSALLKRPDNYPLMTSSEQAAIRDRRCAAVDQHNAQRLAEGKPPVDYADWMREI